MSGSLVAARQPVPFIDYPFPLTHGMAELRLPVTGLEAEDAERLCALIQTLVIRVVE